MQKQPEFEGRQAVTFHNQRDFIFVRHHRYIYRKDEENDKTRAKLQELGPRFTLKLKWLQEGTFNTEFGEYEWINKRKEMESCRRKFSL
jgi:ribosome production factor 1